MKSSNINLLFLFLLSAFVWASCSSETSVEKKAVKFKDQTEEGIENLEAELKTQKESLKKEMEEAKVNLERKMKNLEAKMAEANEDTKEEINEQLVELEARRKLLVVDIEKVGNQIADNWESFKISIKERLEEIDEEIDEEM